ncbi:succinylglutamate desuccinylase/aspartoacylase family protein [Patescibacteria group bacterium]|nr:succinylglutamate desuccinylase/aspartoacylase family protein [Patescibacteria group bacterium]
MKILIIGSTHGHERIGLQVIEELRKLNLYPNQVEFIVGNPKASELGVPFTEGDLNRVFPGKPDGNYEERRAFELSEKILQADLVIDIHSTKTTDLGENSMIIVTKYDEETKRVLELISPPKVLIMRHKSDNALVSQAKIGIAFEYGLDDSESVMNATVHDIAAILMSYGLINQNPFSNPREVSTSSVYDVYDAFKKNFEGDYVLSKEIENFKQINVGQVVCTTNSNEEIIAEEDFYPILFGNNRYKDILGFKAQKL